jgi:hypothetical protein
MAVNGTVAVAKKALLLLELVLLLLPKMAGNGIFIESSPLFQNVERHILLHREMGGGDNDVRAVVVLLPLLPLKYVDVQK